MALLEILMSKEGFKTLKIHYVPVKQICPKLQEWWLIPLKVLTPEVPWGVDPRGLAGCWSYI